MAMDKYGVLTEAAEDSEKTGCCKKTGCSNCEHPRSTCACGNEVEHHGNVKKCTKCGTSPFEVPLTK